MDQLAVLNMTDKKGQPRAIWAIFWAFLVLLVLVLFVLGSTQSPVYLMVAAYVLLMIGIMKFRKW